MRLVRIEGETLLNEESTPVALTDTRQTIPLRPDGAVMSVIAQVLQSDAIKIALGSFCEGRELEGQWVLRITGAELVPVNKA